MPSNARFTQRALALPQMLCVVSAIPMIIAGPAALFYWIAPPKHFTREQAYEDLLIALWIFGISTLIFAASLYWHFKAYRRDDIEPDILAELFADSVFQVGASHIYCLLLQRGVMLRIVIVSQNTRNAPGTLHLELDRASFIRREILPLRCDVGPAAIVIAITDVPIWTPTRATVMPMELNGSFPLHGLGRTVRFRQCAEIGNRTRRTLLTAAMAFGGHFVFGEERGAQVMAQLVPVETTPDDAGEPAFEPWQTDPIWKASWRTLTAWAPENRISSAEVFEFIKRAASA